MEKEKCIICGKTATWAYMPGKEVYCDDCVPRGCTCNVKEMEYYDESEIADGCHFIYWDYNMTNWTKEINKDTFFFEIVDENYRRFPCCEYWWDEDGWEIENDKNNETEKENN